MGSQQNRQYSTIASFNSFSSPFPDIVVTKKGKECIRRAQPQGFCRMTAWFPGRLQPSSMLLPAKLSVAGRPIEMPLSVPVMAAADFLLHRFRKPRFFTTSSSCLRMLCSSEKHRKNPFRNLRNFLAGLDRHRSVNGFYSIFSMFFKTGTGT